MIIRTPRTALANGPDDAMRAGTEARDAPLHCRSHRATNTGFTFLVKSDHRSRPARRPTPGLATLGRVSSDASTALARASSESGLERDTCFVPVNSVQKQRARSRATVDSRLD